MAPAKSAAPRSPKLQRCTDNAANFLLTNKARASNRAPFFRDQKEFLSFIYVKILCTVASPIKRLPLLVIILNFSYEISEDDY